MRHYQTFAAASVLALALAACGPAEETADPAVEGPDTTASAPAAPAPEASASAAPSPEASASASASPSPTPSASATPTQAAAAPATPPAAFTQCGVCHSVQPGQNGIGPSLAGVAGRRSASVSGFSYTQGMKDLNVSWNDSNLDRYLTNPSGMVPGTTMAIGPLNAADRRAIINYLKTL
jgi:cytochrome c